MKIYKNDLQFKMENPPTHSHFQFEHYYFSYIRQEERIVWRDTEKGRLLYIMCNISKNAGDCDIAGLIRDHFTDVLNMKDHIFFVDIK